MTSSETRPHGTRARYAWGPGPGAGPGCRCAACTTANREDAARRARLRAYGRWEPYVDADPVRAHLQELSRAGIGWKRVAELSGVSSGAISRLLFGGPGDRKPAMRVRPETAAAILAVPAAQASLSAGSLVPSAGARRRLQALVAIGWSPSQLAVRLGVQQSNFGTLLAREHVRAGTARAVATLYDQLWNRPPAEPDHRSRISASRARNHAQAHGWPPPMAWDDDLIDNPAATAAAGWQRRDGNLRRSADIAEEAAELQRQGHTRPQIAERLGITRSALDQATVRAARQRTAAARSASEPAHSATVDLTLPSSSLAPRQARAAVRQALTGWGLGALATESELLVSELVANAAEHAGGQTITLALRQDITPGGQRGITCQSPTAHPTSRSSARSSPAASAAAAWPSSPPSRTTAATSPYPAARPPGSPSPPPPSDANARPRPKQAPEPQQRSTGMTTSNQDPQTQRQAIDAARREARSAIERLALDAGAQVSTRPAWTGSDITVKDVDPLGGLNAARNLELGARSAARDYIRQAREAGQSWHDIGTIMNVTRDADRAGESTAEAAYDYAAGQPDPDAPWRERSFRWTCRGCDQAIADHGTWNSPADDEQGHAQDCPRLEATIARREAEWEVGE